MPSLLLLRRQPARRVPPTNGHSQQLRARILHRSGLIRTTRRRDIVVRKRIAETVQVGRVHDARVVVRDRVLVVLARSGAGLDGVDEQGGAVERGAEAGDEGAEFDVGADDKGPRGAAEDVGRGGLGEGQAGAEVEEGGGRVDGAGDGAPGRLGVDGELSRCVLGPDLVDVGLEVAVEQGGVEEDAVVGAQGAQVASSGGLGHDERGPAGAVGGGLRGQALANGVEAVGRHAGDVLGCVGGVGQGQGDGEADKVDVGDVDEELGGVEGELAEIPGQVHVWV